MILMSRYLVLAALVSSAMACTTPADKSDPYGDALNERWSDTGVETAPGDATWEAADAADTAAIVEGATASYDGLRPVRPDVANSSDTECYRAGEAVYVAFDLKNTGDADYHHHPGLILTTDHPDVEIPEATLWVDSLEAGEGVSMEWWTVVGPTVGSGDEVRFTATVTAHGCEDTDEGCPVAHTASIAVYID
jgi:hypothetical protein